MKKSEPTVRESAIAEARFEERKRTNVSLASRHPLPRSNCGRLNKAPKRLGREILRRKVARSVCIRGVLGGSECEADRALSLFAQNRLGVRWGVGGQGCRTDPAQPHNLE